MFTGIIEETGFIRDLSILSEGATLTVAAKNILPGLNVGDSISVNGVCLTATQIGSNHFLCDISAETLQRSTFRHAKVGGRVNLERSILVGGRLGGHFVLGHVDDVGKLSAKEFSGAGSVMSFDFPQRLARYMVHKGSVAINGISLTISSLGMQSFEVAVIPHTFQSTNLSELRIGDPVNLEVDILGKYFERFFQLGVSQGASAESKLTLEYLKRQGF